MAVLIAVLALLATMASAGMNDDLIKAAGLGDLPGVKRLLAAGADVNARNKDGYTALMCASEEGHRGVVQALLAARADVNATVGFLSAYLLAMAHGHSEVGELLLKAGAKEVPPEVYQELEKELEKEWPKMEKELQKSK